MSAMAAAVVEYSLEQQYTPWLRSRAVTLLGLFGVVIGEAIRKAAILTAGDNFTHEMQTERRPNHMLITHGIYRCGWMMQMLGDNIGCLTRSTTATQLRCCCK